MVEVEVSEEMRVISIKQGAFRVYVSSGYAYFERWSPKLGVWSPLFKMEVRDAVEWFNAAVEVLGKTGWWGVSKD